MHAPLVRASSRLAAIAIAAAVAGTLAWSPAHAVSAQADKYGPGKKVATVTTGSDGTVSEKLDVLLKAGTTYWATEAKATTGYGLSTTPPQFTAKPATQLKVTIADTKTPAASPPVSPPATVPRHAPTGQLAHTGGGSIVWALGAGAVLLAGGGATVWATRRHKRTDPPAS